MSFHAPSHTTLTCPPADTDWTLNELGTSLEHFTLSFLGRPKHSEQAGWPWIQPQLLFADSEESGQVK